MGIHLINKHIKHQMQAKQQKQYKDIYQPHDWLGTGFTGSFTRVVKKADTASKRTVYASRKYHEGDQANINYYNDFEAFKRLPTNKWTANMVDDFDEDGHKYLIFNLLEGRPF